MCEIKFWKTRNGVRIPIANMSETDLQRRLDLLKAKGRDGLVVQALTAQLALIRDPGDENVLIVPLIEGDVDNLVNDGPLVEGDPVWATTQTYLDFDSRELTDDQPEEDDTARIDQ